MTDLSKRLRDLADNIGRCEPDVNAIYEAADALDQPAWRPIAEAPMDGTPVLVARYNSTFGWVRGWARYENLGGRVGGGWLSKGFFEPPGNLGLGHPTHFMPLPSPPEDE